jgi:hypothetical protein
MELVNNQNRINELEAENAAITLKSQAIGTLGGVGGVIYANKQNKTFWGKVGYFMIGSIITGTIPQLMYASKVAANIAEINNLKTNK